MKIIEINERGIRVIEDKEIINQAIFQTVDEIPYEISELLSIYDEKGKIELNINLELDTTIIDEIKISLKNEGWKIQENKKIKKQYLIFNGIFLGITIIYFISMNILSSGYEEAVYTKEKIKENLRKSVLEINKKIDKFNENKIDEKEVENDEFLTEKDFHRYLNFISTLSIKAKIKFNEIEFQKDKILIKGESFELEEIFKLKQFISDNIQVKEARFDYIKREGEKILFLIEFENH